MRSVVYVDAGYLLAATATRATGTSLRASINVDYERLIEALSTHAADQSQLPLLRVHWYDSARNGVPESTHETISLLPQVKVRLGRIGADGGQKGVDMLIGLDLALRAPRAADVVYLVSGDADLVEAVEEAQAHGVEVTILGVPNQHGRAHGVSRHLQRTADGLDLLATDVLDAAITPRDQHEQPSAEATPVSTVPTATASPPMPSPALFAHRKPSAPASETARAEAGLVCSSATDTGTTVTPEFTGTDDDLAETIDRVVRRVLATWLGTRSAERRTELQASRPSIPQEIDKALLLDLSDALGIYELPEQLRHQLRSRFWAEVERPA